MSTAMTMLDQIWQMISPPKDFEKVRRHSSTSSENKFGRIKKKGKKSEKKPIVEEKKLYLEDDICQHRSGPDLAHMIRKPTYVDTKEWIATHTISLFHNVNLLYGTVSEFCTAETCPVMQGPSQTQYTWIEERGKKLKCTAPQYVDYVMTFCQKCMTNQELFPTKYAQNFSDNYSNEVKKMLRFLFHVISHIYHAHFARLRQFELHFYLNVVFKHFTYLVREFDLLDRRDTSSLDDLVDAMGLYSTQGEVPPAESPTISSRSALSFTTNQPAHRSNGAFAEHLPTNST